MSLGRLEIGRPFCAQQFGPDRPPRRLTEGPQVQFAVGLRHDFARLGWPHVTPPAQALIEVGVVNSDNGCDGFTPFGGETFGVHGVSIANRYLVRKAPVAIRIVKLARKAGSDLLEIGPMETAGERRRRKLARLCEMHGRDKVAQLSGTNPFALEQVIKGTLLPPKKDGSRSARNLGDAAARAIEAAFDLGEGWFDAPDEVETLSPDALNVARAYDKMTPAEKARLDRLMAAALDVPMYKHDAPIDLGGISGLAELDEAGEPKKKKSR